MLPPLPEGIIPSYIQYMDVIQSLSKQGIQVKVSDISGTLNIPRPGVTRTVKEMEQKGLLQKIASLDDGRVTYISLTEDDADCMIRTIEKFYQIMCERMGYHDR